MIGLQMRSGSDQSASGSEHSVDLQYQFGRELYVLKYLAGVGEVKHVIRKWQSDTVIRDTVDPSRYLTHFRRVRHIHSHPPAARPELPESRQTRAIAGADLQQLGVLMRNPGDPCRRLAECTGLGGAVGCQEWHDQPLVVGRLETILFQHGILRSAHRSDPETLADAWRNALVWAELSDARNGMINPSS